MSKQNTSIIVFIIILDAVKDGTIALQYCPTEDMITDILTKPLSKPFIIQLESRISELDYVQHEIKWEYYNIKIILL